MKSLAIWEFGRVGGPGLCATKPRICGKSSKIGSGVGSAGGWAQAAAKRLKDRRGNIMAALLFIVFSWTIAGFAPRTSQFPVGEV
jgi:hypothetical protein